MIQIGFIVLGIILLHLLHRIGYGCFAKRCGLCQIRCRTMNCCHHVNVFYDSFSVGAFVICWTPGLVILLLDGLSCSKCEVLKYEKYCLVLAECNSLVNPIIYSFRDKDMRTTFKRILCFPWRRMHQHEGPSGIRFESVKTGAPPEKSSIFSSSFEPDARQSILSV